MIEEVEDCILETDSVTADFTRALAGTVFVSASHPGRIDPKLTALGPEGTSC
jgi:hypothetical protein